MRIWASIGLVCFAAAILQSVLLADRIRHLAWNAFKFGIEPNLISAGRSTVIVFFVATAVFASLGLLASRQLRAAESRLRFCLLLSVQMLIGGAVVWGVFLASPLVQIVSP